MPTWKDLAESERLEVVYRHEIEHEGWGEIAQRFGITAMHYDRMAQYYIIKLKAAGEWPPDKPLEFPRIAPSPKKKHLDALRIEGDALILDDPHVPYHDDRILRALARHLSYERIMRMLGTHDNVEFSNYAHMILVSGGKEWRISHPHNSSVSAVVVPRKLADKYEQNIIGAHGHLWGIGASTSGRYCTVDSGMCGDPERISYNMEEDNTRPAMQQGAVIIRQGYPWLLHPRFTDWEGLERI